MHSEYLYDPFSTPEGQEAHKHDRIGILQSRWHLEITELMYQNALNLFQKYQVPVPFRQLVPGSFELPLAARQMATSQYFDALICLGCIIKGETQHNVYISEAVAQGLMQVSLDNSIPVIFGVLTTENYQQAIDRANGTHGNKGLEAAISALEMITLLRNPRSV